jgi:8-hydroxy-5-deazaflavin:NADPH oxidoreductase
MKIAIFGTGIVGQTLATALATKGHQIMIGTRDVARSMASTAPNAYGMPAFGIWHRDHRDILVGNFAEAAVYGELLINASNGATSLETLTQAHADAIGDKILIDVANDLDFSKGMPPKSNIGDTPGSGLAERLQAAFPNLRVVKTLNTMNAFVMVNPSLVSGGDSTVFLSGDDATAKTSVRELLVSLGWSDIMDLGGIVTSRAVEMLMPIWLATFGVLGQTPYNFKIVR